MKKRKPRKLPKSVRPEEWDKLIKEVQKKKDKVTTVAFLLAYGSGMRISEVLKCRKEHFQSDGMILITDTKYETERKVPIPKGWRETFFKYLPIPVGERTLQRRFKKYSSLANLNPLYTFHCVDAKTQILTKEGWKNYKEVKQGDKIFSYNLDKEIIEQDKIREKFIYNYVGDFVYHIKTPYIDSIITPSHKIISKFSIKRKDKDIWNDYKLRMASSIDHTKSKRQIKYLLSGFKKDGVKIGKSRAGILGWVLSDGHISKKGDVTISQSLSANPKKCEIISTLLAESNLKYTIKIQKDKLSDYSGKLSKMITFRILKEDKKFVFEWINKDRTPKYKLLDLCGEDLQSILDNMMLGDGTKNEYCGQNKKRIDFIKILCCFLGKRTGVGFKIQRGKKFHRTYITHKNECDIINRMKEENYQGKVWCVSTKNGTFIAKRNGTIFITGNSLRHGFATRLLESGTPINIVSLALGHSDISTTGIYIKASPTDLLKYYEEKF